MVPGYAFAPQRRAAFWWAKIPILPRRLAHTSVVVWFGLLARLLAVLVMIGGRMAGEEPIAPCGRRIP